MLARKPISQLGPKAGQLQVKVLLIMKPKEFTLDKTSTAAVPLSRSH